MTRGADDQTKTSDHEWVLVGVFTGARGIKGEAIVKSFTENPAGIADLGQLYAGAGRDPLRLSALRQMKGKLAVRVAGVDTRDQAEALKGTEIFLRRADLPVPGNDEFYVTDLEGLEALDGAGNRLGRVSAVHDFGAGPLIEIALDAPRKGVGSAPVLPFTASIVPDIDIAAGRVTILLDEWLEGQVMADPDKAGKTP
ncbi:MAG: 16S rRNA processing protein RimM [Proteobacteria bacterium]|nr:16S rRNA processing protein RimM [Pseudomonadota bacterium]